MKWFNDFSLVMRSSVTAFWDKVQDPERMLHQLLIDMDEEADRVRHSVAEAIADEIQMAREVAAAQADADQWLARAKSAIERGDDASAQAALERKVAAADRLSTLQQEHRRQKEQTEKLQQSVRDLEDKIRQARQKRTLLLARLSGAQSNRRVNEALGRATVAAAERSAFSQFSRLEAKVNREEAIGEAYARLDGHSAADDDLERKFADAERKERLERELKSLKETLKPTA